ncbi:Ketosteroid isomerase-related protein [Lentzea fradiae]|uniref:Ketosteroid isomerase-related protein n=1 Tax=Lentzea fradiae TaxID=200378 RepID=A0A1G7US40_9PSEU|nr:Ketosteroid isomerase-related protein [Lentzea fradiae]
MSEIESFGRQLGDFAHGLLAGRDGEGGVTNELRNEETLRALYQKFNDNDLDAASALLTEDYEGIDVPSGEVVRGREGWKQRQAANRIPMPDALTTIQSLVVKGDFAVAEVVNEGTHTAPFPLPGGGEHAPTGNRIRGLSCELYEFRDGKISKGTLYYDFLTVANQLGLTF